MSDQPYQVGDIVNGHRWTGTTWEPVNPVPPTGPPVTGPPAGPPSGGTGGRPVWKRWWFWVLVVLGAIILLSVLGGRGGSGNASETSSASPTATSQPANSSAPAPTASSPEPTQEASPTPEEPSPTPDAASWAPISLKGSGSKVVKIAKPSDRAAIVTVTHNGESNFVVWTLDSGLKENDLLVNTIGDYKGSVLMDERASDATTRLKIDADGPWTMTIKDVTAAPKVGTSINGTGDGVFIYTGPAGVVAARALGDSNFAVWTYGSSSDLLFNEIGPYSGESVIGEGPLVLTVEATGKWSMRISP